MENNDDNDQNDNNVNNCNKKERRDYRMVFLYEYKLGRKASETARSVNQAFGQGTTSLRTVQHWFKKFRQGNENLEDSERCGRTPRVDLDQLKQAINGNPNKSIRQIAKEIGVARSTVSTHLANLRKQILKKNKPENKLQQSPRKRRQQSKKKKKKETKINETPSSAPVPPQPPRPPPTALPQQPLQPQLQHTHIHPPPPHSQILVRNELHSLHHYNGQIVTTQNFRSFQKFPFQYQ